MESTSISDAISEEAEVFIESIIGSGVAAQQISPGVWVGSLSELEPGKGYWFRANQAVSFQFNN